jgi:hypothetical protein
MTSKSSKPRPSVASALERVLRDVDPGRALPAEPEPEPATEPSSSRYFDPGDYADERSWWAKQLGRQ